MPLPSQPYRLTPIAATGDRFMDFSPYVASLNDAGTVAFQAGLPGGHSGVFTSDGRTLTDALVTTAPGGVAQQFCSHPDINEAGQLTVYAQLTDGSSALLLAQPDGRVAATGAREGLSAIGPLGPTMNEHGDVAFRGTSAAGRACIGVLRGGQLATVAEAGESFSSFEGLPVVNSRGQVAFRADLPGNRQAIFIHQAGRCHAIATTGEGFDEIARFPALNDNGVVAFAAIPTGAAPGVFMARDGGIDCVVDTRAGFESFRGVLINNAGPVAFYATPTGGQLGIYTGPDPLRDRLLGLGDPLLGATVADFALNPVSANERGQLAIRVTLDDHRQFILRADPVT